MRRQTFAVLALIALCTVLLVAGCTTPTSSGSATPTAEPAVTTSSASLTGGMNTPATVPASKQAVLKTTMGEITIALYDDMPVTVGNFERLVRDGFYNNVTFHRVIDGFVIQGGDPTGTGSGNPGFTIMDEFPSGRPNRNDRGTISMANAGPNTGSTQFFINLVDNKPLDTKHPVFGRVVKGMEVVDAIGKVPVVDNVRYRPVTPVVITSASML